MHDATIKAIFETIAPPDAGAAEGAEGMRGAIDALAPHRAKELRRFIALLAAIGFARWPHGARERFLRALGDAPIPALRTAFQALKRLALFLAYSGERNPIWSRLGYPGPRSDVPQATISVPSIIGATDKLKADAIVVGSGAGGGVAAALLARSGRKTIVLEAGPAFEDAARSQLERRATQELFLGGGTAATSDLGISLLAGACVGGGTTVNWSTSLRLTPNVIAQWEYTSGIPSLGAELQASYAAIADRLQLNAASEHNRNNAVIVRGCTALDWNVTAIPRNAGECSQGCGYCGFGCAYGNKRGTAMTYLRDAVSSGARIYSGRRAVRIRIEDGHARGVEAEDMTVDAPLVVIAAGSLRTPGLLSRSGIVSPHLGRHLKLHPTLPVVAEFDEPVEPWHGPIQTALCAKWSDLDDGYGAVIEACPAHPGIFASATPWRSRAQHADAMLRARNCATLIVLTRDRGEGCVSLDGRDDVDYVLSPEDARRMLEVAAHAVELALAAGAIRVAVPFTVPLELRREEATGSKIAAFLRELSARSMQPNRVTLFSAHQMGTARMHADPDDGVVDARGRVHGVEGLWVADGSVFPLSSGVNPMITIMALAHRALVQETPVREGSTTLRT